MRTITGNIKILADQQYADKTLEFVLCNKYGEKMSAISIAGQIATSKKIQTDENGGFSVMLFETDTSLLGIFYKMCFVDNDDIEDIRLFIQEGNQSIDFLKLLFPMPKLNMFYENKNDKIEFKDMVFSIFTRFFVDENIFVNNDENNLIKEFIKYADNDRDSEIMQELDKYLATIGE